MKFLKDIVRVRDRLRLRVVGGPGGGDDTVSPIKDGPSIEGRLTLRLKDPDGRVVEERDGNNIWTLTGREYLAELVALALQNPSRTPMRDDRILYIGLGNGNQSEVAEVSGLVSPIEFRVGEFLAQFQVPPTYTADADGTPRTSVQFIREYASNEISLGANAVISEAGLFTDGDPNADNAIPCPTDFATSASRSPLAYKSFDPLVKVEGYGLEAVWEVMFR